MTDLVVKPVSDKAGKIDFLNVPFPLYRNDPNWVAPLFLERLEHLDPRKNPYFDHADVLLLVAYRNGKPVGRISAQVDHLRIERYRDATGQFGFLEAEDNTETFAALFAAAQDWLKARGIRRVQGPFNFSINDEMGLLIEGFDTPPNMMMGHALPRYRVQVESLGFVKAKDVIAYYTDDAGDYPPLLKRICQRALASGDITLRPLNKKDIDADIRIIMSIFNDAWSDNWGFVPFTGAELTALGKNLKMLVHGDYAAIASYKGEPAAMAVTLPNLNDWISGLNGRLLPFGWARLASKVIAKRPRSVRMPLLGVRKAFQDSMIGSAMAVAIIDRIRNYHIARGVKGAEMSWVLEDNMRMRHIIEELGAKPYKTYRIYEKEI